MTEITPSAAPGLGPLPSSAVGSPSPAKTEWGFRGVMDKLPEMLSSVPVIAFGVFLFFYLFVFAGVATLLGHPSAVSTNTQLILGNYTNVSSSVGAGIAAGTGVAAARRSRRADKKLDEAHKLVSEVHALLHSSRAGHGDGAAGRDGDNESAPQ